MREETRFTRELQGLLNSVSAENDSDTPDFILAEYMLDCLKAYSDAVKKRDKWFNVDMWSENKIAKGDPNMTAAKTI